MTILSKQITAVSHILITGIFIVCITKKTNQNTRKPNHNTTQWGKKKKACETGRDMSGLWVEQSTASSWRLVD